MGRVRQKVALGLQLHVKWVRVMLIVSAVAIIGLIFLPKFTGYKSEAVQEIAFSIDSLAAPAPAVEEPTTSIDTNRRIISRRPSSHMPMRQPVQVQIVQEDEPFDWKGTVTWGIGVLNGLVLIVLNIKNLILKKRP